MTNEQLIKDTLRPLIDQVRNSSWSDDSDPSDAEVLGVIISKFLEWDANKIRDTASSAFEDSNYRARIEFD